MKKIFTTTCFFLSLLPINAQIVYTDVIPDLIFGIDESYFLDVNNDSIKDYEIKQLDSVIIDSLEGVELISLFANDAVYVSGVMDFLDALTNNTLIDGTLPYKPGVLPAGGILYIGNNSYPQGPWINGNEFYMGLRFNDAASNTYFGWCRMMVGTDGLSFTIKDYAYNSFADQPINAGQTIGITENLHENFSWSQQNDVLIIRYALPSEATLVTISGVNGAVVKQISFTGETQIPLNGISPGIYFATLVTSTHSGTFRFIIP